MPPTLETGWDCDQIAVEIVTKSRQIGFDDCVPLFALRFQQWGVDSLSSEKMSRVQPKEKKWNKKLWGSR